MLSALLKWIINTWLHITGKVVSYKDYPWLEGPMSENDVVGDQYYELYARNTGLVIDPSHKGGLLENFTDVIPESDPLKNNECIA